MNKAKGNMYPFVTHTWNPLAGECTMNCDYCSTKRLKERYPVLKEKYSEPPRIVEHEMKSLGSGNFIFVCAQNDLFAPYIKWNNVIAIHDHLLKYPENKYLIQTKNTEGMALFYRDFPRFLTENIILCTTIENDLVGSKRARCFRDINHLHKHITIEPIFTFNHHNMIDLLREVNPEQINIGANSNPNPEMYSEPSAEEIGLLVIAITSELPNTKIILKENLKRLYDGKHNG